jgi:hypothetical protein
LKINYYFSTLQNKSTFWISGENISISAEIDNKSSNNIEKSTAKLIQVSLIDNFTVIILSNEF